MIAATTAGRGLQEGQLQPWTPASPEFLDAARRVLQGAEMPPVIGVVSTIRAEGRTTLVKALTEVLVRDYRCPVVVMDLDLEHPHLTREAGARHFRGVYELVRGAAAIEEVVQPVQPLVGFLPAGNAEGESEHWTAQELQKASLIRRVRAGTPCAIIADLPPLSSATFARTLAAAFPSLALVVAAGGPTVAQVRAASEGLNSIRGVVLNRTDTRIPAWIRRRLETAESRPR